MTLHDGAGKLATNEVVTNEDDCEEFTYNHRISQLERDTQIRNQEWKVWSMPPRPGAKPVIVPRRSGLPRPVTLPSSDSASLVDSRAEGHRKFHKER
jgi:hypothetical protein